MIIKSLISHTLSKTLVIGCTLMMTATLSSCDLVKEDLAPCDTVELRFIYDYNMEFANAFPAQVDCLDVYFYNESGKLVHTEQVTDRSLLSDEDYRMTVTLPEGNYHVVAYGGMGCEKASFSHVNTPAQGSSLTELHVRMDPAALSDKDKARLHNHYFGAVDFTLDYSRHEVTVVPMMRNTNSIQVALQQNNGEYLDVNDFVFEITDDNNDFNYDNSLSPTGQITYIPYNTENRLAGQSGINDGVEIEDFHTAIANFNTSRLYHDKETVTTLHVKRASDGHTIFRVPLVNYMLMFKHDRSGNGLDNMGDQEYLDRENAWNFVFFLENGLWVNTRIIVNDWEVRLNQQDF